MKIALWLVYAIFWTEGVITGGTSPQAPWAAPAFLVLAGVLAFRKDLALAALLGFAAELIGVHTGFPFGHYAYTDALGPKLFEVPVAIAAAWLVVAELAMWDRRFRLSAVILMTAADLIIDPLAAGPLHYWKWQQTGVYYGIPQSNYAGWLLTSALIVSLIKPPESPKPPYTSLSVIAFFTILAARNRLWIPAAIGAIIISVVAKLWYRPSETSSPATPASEPQPLPPRSSGTIYGPPE